MPYLRFRPLHIHKNTRTRQQRVHMHLKPRFYWTITTLLLTIIHPVRSMWSIYDNDPYIICGWLFRFRMTMVVLESNEVDGAWLQKFLALENHKPIIMSSVCAIIKLVIGIVLGIFQNFLIHSRCRLAPGLSFDWTRTLSRNFLFLSAGNQKCPRSISRGLSI